MATLPHDIADLSLAPVVLAIDARIEELSQLNAHDLAVQIASEEGSDRTAESRSAGLVAAVGYLIDARGWELSMDTRGIRLTHKQHTLVQGVPDSFRAYIAGS